MPDHTPYSRQNPAVGRFLTAHFGLLFMPCCLNDARGRAVYWNWHAEQLTGLPSAQALGFSAHARLSPGDVDPLLDLFLAGRAADLETRYGREHLLWDQNGNLTVLDCRDARTTASEERRLLLCGRWRDEPTGESFAYMACAPLGVYDFTLSPCLDLHRLLQGLDRKKAAWFGIIQNELYCYLSQEFIDRLYPSGVTMTDIIGCPVGDMMPPGGALDHARTIAALTPEESEKTVMHWPLTSSDGTQYWGQSYPNILTVNGVKANFSLVLDITAEKERDSALKSILAAYHIGTRSEFSQDLLTMFAGRSTLMSRTLETLLRAALSLVTVAIYGETGTGKNLAARLVHQLSSRGAGPFVSVNCGAIPEELFESSFFGHVKGSFTGAVADKEGLLTKADTGTLFLDEIAELTPRAQAKLLQALSEKSYTPVGSTTAQSSQFRLIVATNRNLEECVQRGTFREDLFYRVNVLDVHLPPLRARKEDIPLLLDNILRRNGLLQILPAGALRLLQAHSWPGNIRELENVALRYAAEQSIDFFHPIPEQETPPVRVPAGGTLQDRMACHERDILLQTLTDQRWNRGNTAEILGISRVTLFRKMREYDLL